jgi:hypothetical protein
MNRNSTNRLWRLGIVFATVALVVFAGRVRGQGDLIGSRGGQLNPAPSAADSGPAAYSTSLFESLGNMLKCFNLDGSSHLGASK